MPRRSAPRAWTAAKLLSDREVLCQEAGRAEVALDDWARAVAVNAGGRMARTTTSSRSPLRRARLPLNQERDRM